MESLKCYHVVTLYYTVYLFNRHICSLWSLKSLLLFLCIMFSSGGASLNELLNPSRCFIMLHSACLIQLFLCFFFSVSHQRSKSTQERLALIPAVSRSSCGWPGRALLPLCLPSGSLGKWEERSRWVESPAAWPSTAAVLICSTLFAAVLWFWVHYRLVFKRCGGCGDAVLLWVCYYSGCWRFPVKAPKIHAVSAANSVWRLCRAGVFVSKNRPSFIGLDQGRMSVLDTWWWRCIATFSWRRLPGRCQPQGNCLSNASYFAERLTLTAISGRC